jgi:hypothetical protein
MDEKDQLRILIPPGNDASASDAPLGSHGQSPGLSAAHPGGAENIHIEARIVEAQQLSREKRDARVTVIRGGASTNGFHYGQDTLAQLASHMEGAQAYADHNVAVPVRSMRDLVGY